MEQTKKVIQHPQGNPLELTISLGEVTVTVKDGQESRVRRVLTPDIKYPVTIELIAGVRRYVYKARTENGTVIFYDNGTLPVGVYRMEIHCRDSEKRPLKYVKQTMVEITESTEGGGTYDTDEFGVVAHYPAITGHIAGVVITDSEVQIHEGIGFRGAVTEGEVQLYDEYGESMVQVTDDEVQIIINE